MGYSFYSTMILIPADQSINFAYLFDRLKERFSQRDHSSVEWEGTKKIRILRNEWSLYITWEDEPHVLLESKEIAERFVSDEQDQAVIGQIAQRIEIGADPDPEMIYFNDYVFLLEVIDEFSGLYVFDPYTGEIKKSGA